MGHKLARMAYFVDHRESEDFGCVLCDDQGRQACASRRSRRRSSGADSRLPPGVTVVRELGFEWSRRRRGSTTTPLRARTSRTSHSSSRLRSGASSASPATTAHHRDLGALRPALRIFDATDAYAEACSSTR